jgi:hypothetical protein
MSSTPTPLTTAQLASLQTRYESQVSQIVEAMKLRRWLVERLIEKLSMTTYSVPDLIELAGQLHDFIIQPTQAAIHPPKESQ